MRGGFSFCRASSPRTESFSWGLQIGGPSATSPRRQHVGPASEIFFLHAQLVRICMDPYENEYMESPKDVHCHHSLSALHSKSKLVFPLFMLEMLVMSTSLILGKYLSLIYNRFIMSKVFIFFHYSIFTLNKIYSTVLN